MLHSIRHNLYNITHTLHNIDHIKYRDGSYDYLREYKKLHETFVKLENDLSYNLRNSYYIVSNHIITEKSKYDASELSDLIYHYKKLLDEERQKIIERIKYAVYIDYVSKKGTIQIYCFNNKLHNIHGPALIERTENSCYNTYFINGKEYNEKEDWEKDRLIFLRKDKINKLKFISSSFD